MRCTVCAKQCSYGAIVLSLVTDEIDTVILCTTCRRHLLTPEIDDRVARLVRLKGWTQPRLPTM
jgi:hypothetical protein